MKVYQYDDQPGDLRLPHYSGIDIPTSHVSTLGVAHQHLPVSSPLTATQLTNLATTKSFTHTDEITYSVAAMGDAYEAANALNNHEHIHDDDEIRYIKRGGGYFDVREKNDDRWVRMKVQEGDCIVLPAGIYHRFAVDENNDVTMVRMFKSKDHMHQENRGPSTEEFESRKAYLSALETGFSA